MNAATRCALCPAPLRPYNRSGYCRSCRDRVRCTACGEMADEPGKFPGNWCAACRAVLAVSRALLGAECRRGLPPDMPAALHAERERRVALYAMRAAAGLPLFEAAAERGVG